MLTENDENEGKQSTVEDSTTIISFTIYQKKKKRTEIAPAKKLSIQSQSIILSNQSFSLDVLKPQDFKNIPNLNQILFEANLSIPFRVLRFTSAQGHPLLRIFESITALVSV